MSADPIYEATDDERAVATAWHGGQGSMFYAVSSTGALSRGTMRPSTYARPMTDAEWSEDLAWKLAREIRETIPAAVKQGEEEDARTLGAWYVKIRILHDALVDQVAEEEEE